MPAPSPPPVRQPLARPALVVRRTRRGAAAGTLAALLGLALVTTAAAPGVVRLSPGDTLSEIAVRWGTTVSALEALNGLEPGDTIYAGRTLSLSGSRTAATASSASGGGRTGRGSVAASAERHRATLAQRDVPSRKQARALVAATARRHGVDPSLALAIAYQESGFQQRVVSGVDAIGVMQVLPSTARGLERAAGRPLDLLRTEDNVTAGVLLLRQLRRSQGSDEAVLAGYYQGIGSVARKGLLPQTHRYIANTTALRARFRNG